MNKIFTILSFALRDASKSRLILVLVIISLSVAFAAIFTTTGILDGFKEVLERGATDWLGHIEITPANNQLSISNAQAIADSVKEMENISGVSIRSYAVGGIKYKDKFINPYAIMGVNPAGESQASALPYRLIEGEFVNSSNPQKITLGLNIADALIGKPFDGERIRIGEKIQLATTQNTINTYTVSGIIDAKTFNPNWTLFIDKTELEKLDSQRKDSEIIVTLKDPTQLQTTKTLVEEKNLGVTVSTWQEEAGYIEDIMEAVSFITLSIRRLVILSVFVVMSIIIFINVFQKRRQIGIIKSMGASNSFIISIYILETFIYSVLAYLLGFFIFLLIHQYSVNHPIPLLVGDFHTAFHVKTLWPTLLVLFIAAIGASFVPAYIASKTKIVNIIQGNI